jgi:hypothetical protein|tara:strand:+ start:829 stop:1446 length:618 start_codon:yes stop_codon:yes gene_type:complete
MNKIPYSYTRNNLLDIPQNYQMSSYEGPDFLISYQFSRKKIITELEKTPDFISFSNNFFSSQDISDVYEIIKKNKFSTNELYHSIIMELISNPKNTQTIPIIDKFLKKFEIRKRIFLNYDNEFNIIGDEFKEIQNYVLLSFMCLIRYQTTSDLKYLNTFLKLNDLICSAKKLIVNKIDISLFHYLLTSEMKYVLKLLDESGIWLE